MKLGGKLKSLSRSLTEYSIRLKSSMLENSTTQTTTKEESKECLKRKEGDGLNTIHYFSAALLKKNNNIEIILRLTLNRILKMISWKSTMMKRKLCLKVSSNSRNMISLRLVCCQNPMKVLMIFLITKFSNINTDNVMTMTKLIQEDKEEYFPDLLIELEIEIPHLNKTSSSFSHRIKKIVQSLN